MNFLQPLALIGLPLILLPIIIHLINQQRHRTVPWAAMMFLMAAKRMSKGMARIRHILILLMRTLAIAALIFAISRPLSGGWLGSIGLAKPDVTMVLLDRSASMETQDLQAGESKRSTALKRLSKLLEQGDYGTHLILIDSATGQLHEVDSPKALLSLPMTKPSATSANIPGMYESALTYLKANNSGRADIWLCSDLHENDWSVDSGRWDVIRDEFSQLDGVHHFLLAYSTPPSNNLSVRVKNVQRWQRGNEAELILDVTVRTEGNTNPIRSVPIEFEVNNVRSVVEVELDARGASIQGHRIPIDGKLTSGWGSVGLPGDANPLDNRFFFVFSEPPIRRSTIVSDDARIGETFRRALAIPPDSRLQHQSDVFPVNRTGEIDWENTGLLIWQAAMPTDLVAEQIQNFVNSGRVVIFFPPNGNAGNKLYDSRWNDWQNPEDGQHLKVSWWRSETDLLARSESGDALPLNDLRTYRYRALESSGITLARFGDDIPLLTRTNTDRGRVYFCSTLPTAQFSSLERDGVVFYVLLQRALAEGCRALADASQRHAAPDVLADNDQWKAVAPEGEAVSLSQRGLQAGVYRDDEYWVAVNRSEVEDTAKAASVEAVDTIFTGLSYRRIDLEVGDTSSLANELWRIFLIAMAVALIVEAVLSLPSKKAETNPLIDLAPAGGEAD